VSILRSRGDQVSATAGQATAAAGRRRAERRRDPGCGDQGPDRAARGEQRGTSPGLPGSAGRRSTPTSSHARRCLMLSSSGRQPRCPPRSRRAGLEEAPPAEALIRLLDAGWQVSARYPFLWHPPALNVLSVCTQQPLAQLPPTALVLLAAVAGRGFATCADGFASGCPGRVAGAGSRCFGDDSYDEDEVSGDDQGPASPGESSAGQRKAAARQASQVPTTLTSRQARRVATSSWSRVPRACTPALVTSTSRRP
jgi:hypothetical protein